MAVDMFLRASGITGESQDINHKGWTDITSFSWGALHPGNMSVGSGGGAGKVTFSDLSIEAMIDKSTSALLRACANGKHLDKVEVSVCKAGEQQIEYCRITLEEVLITAVHFRGIDSNERLNTHYSFQAAKVRQQYYEQTANGGKGPEVSAGWNIKENREI
ncbi:Hcp family type VI secretion system effector [Mixta intestinalis]|uniref:Major exported protein n=1 Tax=Mixta intestinalis TaxID=1615494 RepID=A0A6P1Q1X2_9GAMM|nr:MULTISPECIES: type VI secretion system tube protein Hcp [Mixta]QHM72970.1 hypothetical protein C7M51_03311 [Mixta intestinalis]QHM77683.1 hypothetical protein C7M52_03686 [Mixta theicola]